MKNIRKIVAILAAALMFCTLIPMSVFAVPGDVAMNLNFDDGTNGGFERSVNENGYIAFDATTADWQNTYTYAGGIKANTLYKVTFKAMASKDAVITFKINENWGADTVKEDLNVSTEWQDFELLINSGNVTAPYLILAAPYTAANAPTYYFDDIKIVETVDPELIGKVVNGDFSSTDGWKLGNGATIADGVLKLENIGAWSEAAMQTVPVKANTNYEITWKSQRVSGSGAFNMIVMDSAFANLSITAGQNWMTDTSGNWIDHTITVNTGASEVIIFKLTTEAAGDKTLLIDDIKVSEIKDPSFDGFITNGDFETGKLLPWDNLWGSNTVELVEGYNSEYALKAVANGAWQHVRQLPITVKPNTDYVVKFYAKDASGVTLLVKDSADTTNVAQNGFSAGSEWTPITATFNTGDYSSILLSFMSNEAGATYTVDDLFMFEKVDPSFDGYITNGTFETGNDVPWENVWGSCKVDVIRGGKDSNWAVNVKAGQWNVYRQKITVEPNTDYKFTAYGKDVNNMTLLVKDGNDSGNIAQAGFAGGSDWAETSVEFNSGSWTEVYVAVMGNDADSVGTFDNFSIECLAPACEHEYEYDCSKVCSLCGEETRPEAEHEYFYECDPYCMICYEETNPDAAHSIQHVEAKEAVSCIEWGNREYWFCEHCNTAWLDEACMIQTNMMSVRTAGECISNAEYACQDGECINCGLPCYAEAEHEYDDEYDADCNVCGDVRDVPEKPVEDIIYGDANGDDAVNAIDALMLQQYVAGWEVEGLDEVSADANGDGAVNAIDALLLQQYVAGWEVDLGPAEEAEIFNDGVLGEW